MNIPFNQKWSDNAHYEEKMRAPHMFTKFKNNAKRAAGRIRGLLIEQHVSGWLKQTYPDNYQNPDNYEQWKQWCDHDFKLNIANSQIVVDVTGPQADGSFGKYPMKPVANVDYHIMCKPIGFQSWDNVDYSQGFEIVGVVKVEDYKSTIDPNKIIPFNDWLTQIGL